MMSVLKSAKKHLARLHHDQRGAEGLEKLLIIAAVVLPLLGLLIWFRDELNAWVTDWWSDKRGEAEDWDH
jgi:Flp pilus assembly pilin Flp